MSAILKTLKKLEEEKSLVEQNLDIEDMVKQSEALAPTTTRTQKSSFIAALLGLVGVMISLYYVYQSKNLDQQFEKSFQVTRPKVAPNKGVKASQPKEPHPYNRVNATSGIPLAQIPEMKKTISPDNRTTVFEGKVEDGQGPLLNSKQVIKKFDEPLSKEEKATVAKAIKEATPPVALKEIHTMIEQAKVAAKNQKETSRIKPRHNSVYIPGLKVKGIIFLTANNPFNHILVSTPKDHNKKLKVGQSILGAKLTNIHSDRAVFLYKDKIAETSIGE